MPVYEVNAPDGTVLEVTAPEGASQEMVIGFAKAQMKLKQYKPKSSLPYELQAKDQSFGQNALASFGGAVSGIPLGLRQLFGNANPDELKQWSDSMKGLTSTGGGTLGAIAGGAAPAVVAGMVPGLNTVLGAAGAGAVLGGIEPVQEGETRAGNAVKGGLLNAAVPGAVSLAKTARAVVSPFHQAGREGIAGRTLERFATDPANIAKAGGVQWQSGAIPTLAEASGDTGLSNLQRTIQTMDQRGLVAQRYADNNAARVASLADIAGDPAKREAAVLARKAAEGNMYDTATAATYTVDSELANLLKRPAIRQAMARAENLAANKGRPFSFDVNPNTPFSGVGGLSGGGSRQITGQGLQDLKMALDEMLTDPQSGFTGKAADTIKDLRGQIVGWMEKANPDFKTSRIAYAEASKPINSMDIGQRLLDNHTSALTDFSGNPRMYAEAFARSLRNEGKTVAAATGMRGRGLEDVMSPQHVATLNSLRDELSANSAAQAAGRVPGSPTAQYLVGQDLISKIAGPLGIPKSVATSTFVENMLSRPTSFLMKTPEEKLIGLLSEAMLDPKKAAELVKKGGATKIDKTVQRLLDRSMPFGQGGLIGYGSIPAKE